MTTHTTSAPFAIPAPPAASTTRAAFATRATPTPTTSTARATPAARAASTTRATSHIPTTPAICMRMHMARWRAEPGAAGLTGSSPGGAVACP